ERIARRRHVESGQDAHRRRFPGTVRTNKTHHLSRVRAERYVVHRLETPEVAMEVPKLDRRSASRIRFFSGDSTISVWLAMTELVGRHQKYPFKTCKLISSVVDGTPVSTPGFCATMATYDRGVRPAFRGSPLTHLAI